MRSDAKLQLNRAPSGEYSHLPASLIVLNLQQTKSSQEDQRDEKFRLPMGNENAGPRVIHQISINILHELHFSLTVQRRGLEAKLASAYAVCINLQPRQRIE